MALTDRQEIKKILREHIEVNSFEDYTDYKRLTDAIEKWHITEIQKLIPYEEAGGKSGGLPESQEGA